MSIRTLSRELMALSLGLLLVSCSATRPMAVAPGPTGPHDLGRYALFIQETPDGRVTHDWKPLGELELTRFQTPWSAVGSNRGIVRASSEGLAAYCEGRRQQCEQTCLASPRPVQVGNSKYEDVKATPWRIARGRWCPTMCLEQAVKCTKGRGWAEEYVAEFSAMEPALEWIKTHREEIAVGATIVIAGVAFVAVVAATSGGALILVPVVFLTESPEAFPTAFPIAEAAR